MRIRRISNAFEERFADFKDLSTDFGVIRNPFLVNAEKVPQKIRN